MFARMMVAMGLLMTLLFPATVIAATDPFGKIDCSGNAADSTVCQTKGNTADPITGKQGVLSKATDIIAFIAGIAAIIFVVVSGIQYITSQGSPDEISKAKQSIIYALVGLVIIVLARQIINFVLTRV